MKIPKIGEAKKGGVIAKSALYAYLSKYSKPAIKALVELLDSRNQYIRLGAAKAILDKVLPDLKPVKEEIDDHDLKIEIVEFNEKRNNLAINN